MKNNLLKFGLLVLLAVFTFHSCSDDEQVISPKSVDSIKITIEDKIDNEELNNKIGQDLLKIRQAFQINTTNHKGENYQKKTENDSISIEDIEINIEAFNVIENENGKASYTFEVDFPLNNLDSQEIINLHFYYDENNQLKRQLIKYELSNEELQTVIENQSFDGFWDRISYSNLDDLETTPNSEKITAARSSDPCSCKSKKSTVKWKTPYSNNSGYGGYSSGTGGSGGQTPFSVIPISLQKLWGIAPASAYYPGPNYVGPTCNCNYTIPVRYFSVGDLTIPNTNSNSTPTPFNRRYFYYFPELKNKITTYYNQVYVSYINSYMTSTQTTLEDHNNKQRFITQFFKFLYKLRTENYSAFNYLANNPQKTVAVFNFLAENNSFNAYEFAKSTIDILSLPVITSNNKIDYAEEILRLTNHLKSFGNIEDEIYADYIQSLIPEFNSMTINEVRAIYGHVKTTCNNLTVKYLEELLTPIVTDLVIPVITYALFEATAGTAVKLLQKIPLPLVLRGARLNNLILKTTELGNPGFGNARLIPNSTVAKAEALFASLTKDAISVVPAANNPAITVAHMGNGMKIILRPISQTVPSAVRVIEYQNFNTLLGVDSFSLKFIP